MSKILILEKYSYFYIEPFEPSQQCSMRQPLEVHAMPSSVTSAVPNATYHLDAKGFSRDTHLFSPILGQSRFLWLHIVSTPSVEIMANDNIKEMTLSSLGLSQH